MMQAPPFTITNDSVTVVWQSQPFTVRSGAPNFLPLRQAIIDERWEDIANHLTVGKSLEEWAKGKFTVVGTEIQFDGTAIPKDVNNRICAMAARGEDPSPLFKFWERLQTNPSWRSVQQLYPFLSHKGIPITEDGCFLAYKGVKDDFYDVHSGRYLNTPGQVLEMPRNQISDDPNHACHVGFHVGARDYAVSFGPRTVICKVDPSHVVCIPYDSGQQKMRVCRYEVIGHDNGQYMSSTTIANATVNTPYHGDEVGADDDASEPDLEDEVVDMEPGDDEHEESEDSYSNYNDDQEDEDPLEVKHPENDINVPLKLTDKEKQMLDETHNVIGVIKLIRDRRPGTGLKEAKMVVDVYLARPKKPAGRVVDLMEPNDGGYIISEPKRKSKKGYAKLDKMDMDKLMQQSIDDLRDYAGKGLAITGASKIPGGKAALVARIMAVRA